MFRLRKIGDEEISEADARNPMVRRALELQLRRTTSFSAVSVPPTGLALTGLLWNNSDHGGLVIWLCLILANSLHWIYNLVERRDESWIEASKWIHCVGGAGWGLLPIIAMPEDPLWQLFVAALLLGVQASNVLFSSQLRHMFYRFHVPLVVFSVAGFVISADGPARWGAALLLYAGFFSAGLSEINHATALSAAVMTVRSSELASGLELERQALSTANEQLIVLSRTDPLTGLANRLAFTDLLSEALAEMGDSTESMVAVAYIDLDRFKKINDSLGHSVGDLLLMAIARRLSSRLVGDELLARFGGDELVVLSPKTKAGGGLDELGQRLRSSFVEPFTIDGRRIEIGASIGVAAATGSTAPDELLRFADTALYEGKSEPGTIARVFDAQMREELRRRESLEIEIEAAVLSGQMAPWFQPIVELESGTIVAAEALVRWEHPNGVRTAANFLDVAADRGLVGQISQRVLGAVIDQRLLLASQGTNLVEIAVNVSPHHLDSLLAASGATRLDGVTIEMTEEAVFASVGSIEKLIDQAHERGAKVVLDDFGTGFSSLSMAMDFNVDGYKIDRRFVAGLADQGVIATSASAVIAAVVELARVQGRTVVAEGVETPDQADCLSRLGVTLAQGYLYSPAVPLERWLDLGGRLGPQAFSTSREF